MTREVNTGAGDSCVSVSEFVRVRTAAKISGMRPSGNGTGWSMFSGTSGTHCFTASRRLMVMLSGSGSPNDEANMESSAASTRC